MNLLTDREIHKDKCQVKHNLLGRGNKLEKSEKRFKISEDECSVNKNVHERSTWQT